MIQAYQYALCSSAYLPLRFFPDLLDDMVVLAEPDPDDIVRAIEKAISILPSINPEEMHNRGS